MKWKEFLKADKKKILFFIFGCFFALSLEQLMWWALLLFNHGNFHNDWWIFISEDISSWEENGKLKVLYTTDTSSARLVYNIWTLLLIISLTFILSSLLIWIYGKVKKK